jgi:hypothetical protein
MARVKLTEEERRQKRNEAVARYRERNREKEMERQKAYRSTPEFKERHRQKMLEWRRKNPEKSLEISRRNYKNNGDKQNEQKRLKLKTDPEYARKIKEREARYKASGRRQEMHKKRYEEKTDEIKQKSREWKQNNRDKVKEYIKKFKESYWLQHQQQQRENLDDCYVIAVIKKQTKYTLKTEDIPAKLVEVKKQSLKLKRELKNQRQ